MVKNDYELFSNEELKKMRESQKIENEWIIKTKKSNNEIKFTSTGSKLESHIDEMKKFKTKEIATPIVSHIMPTDICNLACSFCSVGQRTDADKDVEVLDFKKIKNYIKTLKSHGLKAVIFSGGGEPTIYKDRKSGKNFNDLIDLMSENDLEVGLITNGTNLDSLENIMDKISWTRVSLYPSEYGLDRLKINISIPKNMTLGFSLVIAQNIKINGLQKLSMNLDELVEHYSTHLEEIIPFIEEKNGQYLRLTPDCHVHGKNFILLHEVSEKLKEKFGDIVFHQHKSHGTPNNCFLGYFHPVLYANGLVYACDSNILNDEVDRRFKKEYSIATWKDVSKLYTEPVESLINTNKMCPRCVFVENNNKLEEIKNGDYIIPSSSKPTHVNFI